MIKKILFVAIAVLLLHSCASTVNTKSQTQLKGDWTITDVKYMNASGLIIKTFDLADAMCFEGSTWKFIPNNNSGNFSITEGEDCPASTSNIKWSITPENKFMFKYVDGVKAKEVTTGYALTIQNQTENSFELIQDIPYEGRMVQIMYTFTKK